MQCKILILGSGSSIGVPSIGCKCSVCMSQSFKNKRLRPSALIYIDGKKFFIDVSPDIRSMALSHNIDNIDAIFLTHPHEDHSGGMNDLRPYYLIEQKKIPVILSQHTYDVLRVRFDYLIDRFDMHIISNLTGNETICGVEYKYFTYSQGDVPVNGFRFNDFVYITDIKNYSVELFNELIGVKTLILSLNHEHGSNMHFSLEEAICFIESVSPEKCYFTHISHSIDHDNLNFKLPIGIELAYDGLIIYV